MTDFPKDALGECAHYIRGSGKRQGFAKSECGRRRFAGRPLKTQSVFQLADAIARNGQFRPFGIFQAHEQAASEPGMDLIDEIRIDDDGAMNADKARRVEIVFEFGDGTIDHVVIIGSRRIGQFVLCEKVRDPG